MIRPSLRPRPAIFSPASAWVCLGLVLAGWASPALAGLQFEEGIASDPGSGAERYREQHWVRREDGRAVERLVLYRCANGTAFGRKRVDYRQSRMAPAFAMEDRRSGYREGLRRRDGGASVYFAASGTGREVSRELPSATLARLVADAGFDEYIRSRWSELADGRRHPVAFAVPSRLRSLDFWVQRVGAVQVQGEAAWRFRLELKGALGWLVPAIELSYAQAGRRLLRFEGLGNVRDDAGDGPLQVRIDFPLPARPAAEQELLEAGAAPLSACRTGR